MDELFKKLARGEMPDFLEVLAALNDVSDIDWNAIEASQLSIRDVLKAYRVSKHPTFRSGEFCDTCG